LYVADDGAVRKVSARTGWLTNLMGTGSVGPLGDGGPATKAMLFNPESIAVGASGRLVIADTINERIRVVG
jgi:serine/threonine-protein kinase